MGLYALAALRLYYCQLYIGANSIIDARCRLKILFCCINIWTSGVAEQAKMINYLFRSTIERSKRRSCSYCVHTNTMQCQECVFTCNDNYYAGYIQSYPKQIEAWLLICMSAVKFSQTERDFSSLGNTILSDALRRTLLSTNKIERTTGGWVNL